MENLPQELLIEILLLAIEPWKQAKGRFCLGRVCRRWRESIYNYHLFWTELLLHKGPKAHDSVLVRNPIGPLDIMLKVADFMVPDRFIAQMKVAAELSTRWRRLLFQGELTPAVIFCFQRPTPRLENIQLFPDHQEGGRSINLNASGERLRELHITAYPKCLNLEALQLSRLEVLRLEFLSKIDSSHAHQLHAVLKGMPVLRVLALGSPFPLGNVSRMAATDAISLPHLVSITVVRLQEPLLWDLFLSIDAPACHTVLLEDLDLNAIIATEMASKLGSLLRIPFSQVEYLTISYNEFDGYIKLYDKYSRQVGVHRLQTPKNELVPGMHIEFLRFRHTYIAQSLRDYFINLLRWMEKSMKPICPVNITFRLINQAHVVECDGTPIELDQHPNRFDPTIFDAMPFVTDIIIENWINWTPILEHLSTPRESPETGGESWPCPSLRTISLGPLPGDEGTLRKLKEEIGNFRDMRPPGLRLRIYLGASKRRKLTGRSRLITEWISV